MRETDSISDTGPSFADTSLAGTGETGKAVSFEDAVSRLEEIVVAMESGALPLDECLRRFEQAVSLSRYCAEKLESAEKQIRCLTAEEGMRPHDAPWAAATPDGPDLDE